MRTLLCLCTGLVLGLSAFRPGSVQGREQHAAPEATLDPLERLRAGNQRYQSGKAAHFDQDAERRKDLAREQHPYALIVGCSDSRVPPEIVFDQGLGELFVVRTAGEALDELALASIEYAVEHLDVRTIVVLGHERCGAVTAALQGGDLPGHLESLVRALQPHVEGARRRIPAAEKGRAPVLAPELVDAAVLENVRAVVAELEDCQPILSELRRIGELRVVGARYDLDSGAVDWLPAPPH